ncbi:hypothetical protein Q3G72_004915 [Acer saccharum]|nr:hypothetical protein Q3G72_004915 [Acer saccharum]
MVILFYYKGSKNHVIYGLLKSFISALHTPKDNVDADLTFASLLLEDAKHDEAISLFTPPNKLDNIYANSDKSDAWWLNRRIKMKLCHIYRAKGYLRISPIHSCPWFVNHFTKRKGTSVHESEATGDNIVAWIDVVDHEFEPKASKLIRGLVDNPKRGLPIEEAVVVEQKTELGKVLDVCEERLTSC